MCEAIDDLTKFHLIINQKIIGVEGAGFRVQGLGIQRSRIEWFTGLGAEGLRFHIVCPNSMTDTSPMWGVYMCFVDLYFCGFLDPLLSASNKVKAVQLL